MTTHRTCDGMKRRDMLKAGTLSLGGLTLSNYLRMAHAGQIHQGRAERAIFIELPGGPSHLDTFDMKPDAPAEIRGTMQPIPSSLPGLDVCELLPHTANLGWYLVLGSLALMGMWVRLGWYVISR